MIAKALAPTLTDNLTNRKLKKGFEHTSKNMV